MKQNYLRRILSALVLLMAATLAWAYDFEADGICYNILDDESVKVTSHYDSSPFNDESSDYRGDIVIPSTVTYDGKTYNVTGIGTFAFFECSRLVSVDIPEGVTNIEVSAFNGCSSLTSIDIPGSVMSIEIYAFSGCTSLTSVVIGDGVTSIGDGAFRDCSSLESIVIPESVTSIGNSAFQYCSSLTSINIPDGVTSIGTWAFERCSSLESIVIPESVTSIGNGAFVNCSSLTSIDIPESVTSIGYSAFYGCSSLTSIDIPDGVTSIESGAFYACSSLKSINIPDGVTSIGENAFLACSSLTSINIPESVTSIEASVFNGCFSLTSIDIPGSVTSIGQFAFYGCSSLTSISIPDGVTSIGERAFQDCSALESINIPDGVTSISSFVFAGCSSLTSIDIPDGVTSIGDRAFYWCPSLTSIVIPDGVTSIGEYAFCVCSSLSTIICRAENAPELGRDGFDYYYFYENYECSQRLYVPASALEDYKTADQWQNFETILPIVELDYAQKEGWNTIVLPFSADLETFGEGAKAYAFTGATNGVLSFSTVDHLEAHTPYIIYAPEAQELSLNNFHDTTDPNTTTAPSVEHSGVTFRGTYEDIDAPDMQGKYGVADDARIRRGSELASIKAYHAYFEAAAGAEVKAISFDGDDATGITEIADALQQDVQYYNLAGQRTQKPQKGVNIVNGKKVLY